MRESRTYGLGGGRAMKCTSLPLPMCRREFITLVGGAAAWPLATRAQQGSKVDRIGLLRVGPPPPSFIEPFRRALNDRGRVEGKNYIIDFGIAESVDQLPDIAADLVRRNVDVLVASGTPAVLPARDATNVIPIVIVAAIDPIATGVVTSLARPGGNLTGLTAVFADLTGKRLELLKEFFPTLNRVALVSRPANPAHALYVQQTELAARQLDVALRVLALSTPDEFEPAFRDASGVDALIQIDDAMFTSHRRTLVELATKYRIPGSYGLREFVDIGGFMALGPSYPDLYRRAALVVDKILKGRRIGVLLGSTAPDRPDVAGFLQALQQLGWSEGHNLRSTIAGAGAMPPIPANTRRSWSRSRRTPSSQGSLSVGTSGKIKTKPSETRSAAARAKGTRKAGSRKAGRHKAPVRKSKIKIEQNNADQ